MKKYRIYLDDIRTPTSNAWDVVRSYEEFVDRVKEVGLDNIEIISLDHDLGDSAMSEYFNNVSPNYELDYDNITEKTGMDCCKWLVDYFYDMNPDRLELSRSDKRNLPLQFPNVTVHSANPIGSSNMIGYINNFLMNEAQDKGCMHTEISHTV